MSDDDLNYEDVIDVWEREKEAKLPCRLPNNFYERLRWYIQDLEEQVEDIEVPPKDKRERRVQKQYQRVKKISELFFKERQKKIVLAAYHKSLGKTVEIENLLDSELELLDEIATLLEDLKNKVFLGEYKRKADETKEKKKVKTEKFEGKEEKKIEEGIEGSIGEGKVEEKEEAEVEKSSRDREEFSPTENRDSKTPHPDLSPEVETQDEVLVHITEDVPSFVDIDATYDLEKEDVLTLREDLAKVLIERGKAKKIKL